MVCSHKVIDIQLNEDGFYQPLFTNKDACVECGLCVKVCSFINDLEYLSPLHSYAAWSKDDTVRSSSTSGGVSSEVAKHLIKKGFKFCGVRYNSELNRAEHYIASDIESVEQSKGSKYLQSFTLDAFLKIDRKGKFIVVGTPCQVASFRRYIELFRCSDNFVLMDFFCHGVPSNHLWLKYLSEHSKGIGQIKTASWRNKNKGWRKSYCITLEGTKGVHRSGNGKDDFFTMFLGDACLCKACYDSCKFKYNHSAADIRIGDFWGNKYKENKEGVCSAIAFTEVGDKILKGSDLELVEQDFSVVAAGQMLERANRPWYYKRCMKLLTDDKISLSKIIFPVFLSQRVSGHLKRLIYLLSK